MNTLNNKRESDNANNYLQNEVSQYPFATAFFYPYVNLGIGNKYPNFKEMNNSIKMEKSTELKLKSEPANVDDPLERKFDVNGTNPDDPLMAISHEEYFITCDMCDFQNTSHREMDVHRLSHGLKKNDPTPAFVLSNESQYGNSCNIIINKIKKEYSCDMCPYSAKTSQQLTSHKKSHSEEKVYSCNQCLYKCKYLSGLKYHHLSHSGSKLYKCDECKFTCLTATLLKSHKRKHSNIAPYSCQLCSYRCKYPAGLRYHTLTHTKGKDISCEMCSYTCRTSSELKIHNRKHVPQPSICEYCGFSCKTKKTMTLHKNSNCRLQTS